MTRRRSHDKRCTHGSANAADTTWSKRRTMCLEPTLHEGTQLTQSAPRLTNKRRDGISNHDGCERDGICALCDFPESPLSS